MTSKAEKVQKEFTDLVTSQTIDVDAKTVASWKTIVNSYSGQFDAIATMQKVLTGRASDKGGVLLNQMISASVAVGPNVAKWTNYKSELLNKIRDEANDVYGLKIGSQNNNNTGIAPDTLTLNRLMGLFPIQTAIATAQFGRDIILELPEGELPMFARFPSYGQLVPEKMMPIWTKWLIMFVRKTSKDSARFEQRLRIMVNVVQSGVYAAHKDEDKMTTWNLLLGGKNADALKLAPKFLRNDKLALDLTSAKW